MTPDELTGKTTKALAQRFGTQEDGGLRVTHDLTQEEIAAQPQDRATRRRAGRSRYAAESPSNNKPRYSSAT